VRGLVALVACREEVAILNASSADRYAADAYHLLRAGLAGDESKGVPDSRVAHPRVFLTLTAPSFGPVHSRKVTHRGLVIPCRYGERHHPVDPRLATPVNPEGYD
jgi:hypothetical protein